MSKKLISIIIPTFNEEKNILPLFSALKAVIDSLENYNFELIFINDGSSDNSVAEIRKIADFDSHIRLIDFSRNFGKEMATSAGLHHAQGEAAIMIDADMQHPPALIAELVAKWEKGAEIVIGVRSRNKDRRLFKKLSSSFFYHILNAIGDIQIVPNATDYRLVDRIVIDEFNRFTERNRITRGLLDWLGFRKDFVYFVAEERKFGQASYSKAKLIKLALSTFVANSLLPLKLAGYIGIFIILTSGPLGAFIFVDKYILEDPFHYNFSSPAILAVINLFLIGIVLSSLGLIALYIGSIYGEVINRPMYVIRRNSSEKNKQSMYE